MNARQEIAELLEQWLRLTRAEATAIQSADWPQISRIHADKSRLQKDLTEAENRIQASNPGKRLAGDQHPFRRELTRLISLETRNEKLLADQLQRARARNESLNEAARNLRKIQRSYTVMPQGALNCYS